MCVCISQFPLYFSVFSFISSSHSRLQFFIIYTAEWKCYHLLVYYYSWFSNFYVSTSSKLHVSYLAWVGQRFHCTLCHWSWWTGTFFFFFFVYCGNCLCVSSTWCQLLLPGIPSKKFGLGLFNFFESEKWKSWENAIGCLCFYYAIVVLILICMCLCVQKQNEIATARHVSSSDWLGYRTADLQTLWRACWTSYSH